MERREHILAWLESEGISYQLVEHPAAYTMEDIQRFGFDTEGQVCKNLFLRDSNKGKHHYLVSVAGGSRADLVKIGALVGKRLSFASEGRLARLLNLEKGAVTPLGVYFNQDHSVRLLLDARLASQRRVGVHPGDNRATVFLRFEDLVKLLQSTGNPVEIINLAQDTPE